MVKRQPKGSKEGGRFAPDHSGSAKVPTTSRIPGGIVWGKPGIGKTVPITDPEQYRIFKNPEEQPLTAKGYQNTGKYRAEKLQEDVTPEGFAKLESAISDLEKFIKETPFRAYAEDAAAEQLPVLLQRKADALEARQFELSR